LESKLFCGYAGTQGGEQHGISFLDT